MKARTTLILVIVSAVAVAAIWLFEKDRPGTDALREMKGLLLPGLDVEEITAIVIERHEQPAVELRRAGGGWSLERPVRDRADSVRVDRLLRDLSEARAVSTVPAGEIVGGDSATGLDEESLRVRISGGAAERELRIGSRDVPGGLRYVRTGDGASLSLVPSSLADDLPAGADELRDRSLFDLATVDLDRVSIERDGTPLLTLERRDRAANGAWWVSAPFDDEADAGAASALVGQVLSLRAATIVDELDPAELLTTPVVTITLEQPDAAGDAPETAVDHERKDAGASVIPDGRPRVLRIGGIVPGTPLRFAAVSDRPTVFEVDAGALLEELAQPAGRLRSMAALHASTWDVDEIVVTRGEQSITVDRVDGEFDVAKKWRLVDPEDAPFDPSRFDSLIGPMTRIDALRIDAGVTPEAAGLDAPVASLILRYEGRGEARLDVGRSAAEGEVYARRSGRPAILIIASQDAARIDPSELAQDGPQSSAQDAAENTSP